MGEEYLTHLLSTIVVMAVFFASVAADEICIGILDLSG
jgi:hypothetical protein